MLNKISKPPSHMRNYKLITFDFTGTLMRFRLPPVTQYERIARLYGIEIKDNYYFQKQFKTAFKAVNEEYPNFGASSNLHWTQWWLHVVKGAFLNYGISDGPHLEEISWHLIKLYSTAEGWVIVPGVKDLLQLLIKKGKRIGVISNMDPRIENVLEEAGLRDNFEFVVSSYNVKCLKPHGDIFKVTLEKFCKQATLPEECCHIGDSYLEDYLGAKQSGWGSLLISSQPPDDIINSAECHRSIEELTSCLLSQHF